MDTGADADCVAAERRRMWMIGEAAHEGTVVASTGTAQIVPTFSCVLGNEGVFGRTLMPSEAGTARTAGIIAEKTNEMRLMRWPPMAIR